MSQGDGAPDGHMAVIGAGLNDGAHAALQRDLGQDVVPQTHAAGVGQLGAAQVDLVLYPHEFNYLLPARNEARAEHVVDAEGLARRGGRRGGVVHSVWELLQTQCLSHHGSRDLPLSFGFFHKPLGCGHNLVDLALSQAGRSSCGLPLGSPAPGQPLEVPDDRGNVPSQQLRNFGRAPPFKLPSANQLEFPVSEMAEGHAW